MFFDLCTVTVRCKITKNMSTVIYDDDFDGLIDALDPDGL